VRRILIPLSLLAAAAALVVPNALPGARTVPQLPALKLKGNSKRGKHVFINVASCANCHTLRDAHATGRLGPNLDHAKPSFALVVRFVSLGATLSTTDESMPAFSTVRGAAYAPFVLTNQQIADVATYVSSVAGR
jgi:mono/diheme cytochrome c family protein